MSTQMWVIDVMPECLGCVLTLRKLMTEAALRVYLFFLP